MLKTEYFPIDEYHADCFYNITCDVCGKEMLDQPTAGQDLNYIKKSLEWKSVRLRQGAWIDLCSECYERHPELHFQRPTAAEDFAGVAEIRKENTNE